MKALMLQCTNYSVGRSFASISGRPAYVRVSRAIPDMMATTSQPAATRSPLRRPDPKLKPPKINLRGPRGLPGRSETVIQTRTHDIEVGAAKAGVKRRERTAGSVHIHNQCRFGNGVAAHAHIHVFGLEGQVVQQGVFETGARRPTGVDAARCASKAGRGHVAGKAECAANDAERYDGVIDIAGGVFDPAISKSAGDIGQEPFGRKIAQPASHGTEPSDVFGC